MTKHKIEEGTAYLCIKDYVMHDQSTAYSEGKEYFSESDDCITDNENDKFHEMKDEPDFLEHFKVLGKHNNGWIAIGESDLPSNTECHFYDIHNNEYWISMVDKYGNFSYENKATHYQVITQPKPPIY